VALESVKMRGPEAPEGSQPRIDLLKRFRPEPVQAPLRIHRCFHETRVAEDTKVLRHGRLRHVELPLDLSDGLLGGDEEAEYGAAVGFGDDLEGFHMMYILL
jgi:hypothetical protein